MKIPDPNYRDDQHIDAVLAAVRAAWTRDNNRHMRLGQIVSNLAYYEFGHCDSYYLEDSALTSLCEMMADGREVAR